MPGRFDFLQGLALGFGQEEEDEEKGHGGAETIDPEGFCGADTVNKVWERLGDKETADPDAEGGDRHGATTELRGKDFGTDDPWKRPHRHRKPGNE